MKKQVSFQLEKDKFDTGLFASLSFQLEKEKSEKSAPAYFDTFDYAFLNAGITLYTIGKNLYLKKNGGTDKIQPPAFKIDDRQRLVFSDEELKKKYQAIYTNRAIYKQVRISQLLTYYRVLDENQKTIARLEHQSGSMNHRGKKVNLSGIVKITPLRGYQAELNQMAKHLAAFAKEAPALLGQALEVLGRPVGFYQPKPTGIIDKKMPANRAVTLIWLHLLQAAEQNEEGAKKDLDIEFVHDFRVAVRRIRSLLSLVGQVVKPELVVQAKADFKALAKRSNVLRDNDVYLEQSQHFYEMIGPEYHAGLSKFFKALEMSRERQFRSFKRYLASKAYRDLVGGWQRKLQAYLKKNTTGIESQPVFYIAKLVCDKQAKRVIKKGRKIQPETADEVLHNLRIDCKKLRYSLEFFGDLFDGKKINIIVKNLKVLQNVLGEFNDLSVQEETLQQFIDNEAKTSDTKEALAQLIKAIVIRRHRVREDFEQAFAVFTRSRKQMKELFAL